MSTAMPASRHLPQSIGAQLSAVFEQARAAWPTLCLEEAVFLRHLASLGWDTAPPPFALQVYLACACGQGAETACRIFDRTYANVIRGTIKNVCHAAHRVEEIQQAVREKLFVGPAPGILRYSGRAPLEAWLRLVVKRAALDAERMTRRSARREASLPSFGEITANPIESELDRRRYAALLQSALTSAVTGLPARDFDVLRLHYASGVGIDALGRVFGVHRATAARWIEKIQSQLRAGLRQSLEESSGKLTDDELRELLGLADTRAELHIACWGSGLEPPVETCVPSDAARAGAVRLGTKLPLSEL